jgi:hypothetical protein
MSTLNTQSDEERDLLELARSYDDPFIRRLAQEQLVDRFDYSPGDFPSDVREVSA